MNKSIFSPLIIAILFLQSCGGSSGKIGTTDGATFARSKISENVKSSEDILRITLAGETDGSNMQIIDVYYADASLKDEVKCKRISLLNEAMTAEDNKPLSFAVANAAKDFIISGNTKKITEFDFTKMPVQIEDAKKMIPKGYSYFGIASYDLFGNKTLPYKITLNATKDGEAKTTKAYKVIETTYYQFNYEVDGSGKLTLQEE